MLEEQFIFLNQNFETKDDVLQFLAEKAVRGGKASHIETVYQAFLIREKESSTGLMDGFAIPHAKSIAITQACCIVVKNDTPIEWHALDGKGCTVIIALLIPETQQGTIHLQALSKIARLLMKPEVKQGLTTATTKDDVLNYLTLT